jgi:hypothetical protein
MTKTNLKNLRIFASLCGQEVMPKVVLVTTMWGTFTPEQQKRGEARERELKSTFWKDMVDDGCRTERFKNTYESAWYIIGSLGGDCEKPVDLLSRVQGARQRLENQEAAVPKDEKSKPRWIRAIFWGN